MFAEGVNLDSVLSTLITWELLKQQKDQRFVPLNWEE